MRTLLLSALTLAGCTEAMLPEDTGADLAGQDEKGDATPGIEVQSRLRPGSVDVALTPSVPRPGFVFYAAEGSKVTLEVGRNSTPAGLDTKLVVYGPRLADGTYPKTIASDDDSGYGKLSKVAGVKIAYSGFYLAEVQAAGAPTASAKLTLSCAGTCDSDAPVQPLGLELQWYQRSAERRGISLQTYAAATAAVEAGVHAGSWGVVMDIDETTLDNSPYQRARSELGTGYSQGTWTAWVNQKAAKAIPGALAFTQRVHALGGKVVFVTNRLDGAECPQTQDNLRALGFSWDDMKCKTTTSDKNPRFAQVASSMEIVAFVGDNILDFPALSQDVRTKPDSAYDAFGTTQFLIPNPMYGSFQANTD